MDALLEVKDYRSWLRRNGLWLALLSLTLVPHLLAALQLDFAAMLAIYPALPAGMGPLSLLHAAFMRQVVGYMSVWSWLSAAIFATLWLMTIRWLWGRRPELAILVYGLGWLAPAWLLYSYFLPPT